MLDASRRKQRWAMCNATQLWRQIPSHSQMLSAITLFIHDADMSIWFNYLWLKNFILSVHSCGYWLWALFKCVCRLQSITWEITDSSTKSSEDCRGEHLSLLNWGPTCSPPATRSITRLHLSNELRWEWTEEREGEAGRVNPSPPLITQQQLPHHFMQSGDVRTLNMKVS